MKSGRRGPGAPWGLSPPACSGSGRVRNWARLVKGKVTFDRQAEPATVFAPDEVDLAAGAAGRVSDAAEIDSSAPGNAPTATTRPSDSPECPQEEEGASTRVSAVRTPEAA